MSPTLRDEMSAAGLLDEWLLNDGQREIPTFDAGPEKLLVIVFGFARSMILEQGRYVVAYVSDNDDMLGVADEVFILAGCSNPFILRAVPHEDDAYTLVAPCYCDGK